MPNWLMSTLLLKMSPIYQLFCSCMTMRPLPICGVTSFHMYQAAIAVLLQILLVWGVGQTSSSRVPLHQTCTLSGQINCKLDSISTIYNICRSRLGILPVLSLGSSQCRSGRGFDHHGIHTTSHLGTARIRWQAASIPVIPRPFEESQAHH